MTKYFQPKPVVHCLTCGETVYELKAWPRNHKSHIFIHALQFGRKGEENADDGSTAFADTNDHLENTPTSDTAGKTPILNSLEYIKYQEYLAKGIKPPTKEEEEKIILAALGVK